MRTKYSRRKTKYSTNESNKRWIIKHRTKKKNNNYKLKCRRKEKIKKTNCRKKGTCRWQESTRNEQNQYTICSFFCVSLNRSHIFNIARSNDHLIMQSICYCCCYVYKQWKYSLPKIFLQIAWTAEQYDEKKTNI